MNLPIYMDNHATTAIDQRVLDAMLPFLRENFGNAASRSHVFGWKAEEAVEAARGHVARIIGASAREIVFTSGATEANNLALFGVAKAYAGKGNHIITQATEHKAVLDAAIALKNEGAEVTILEVAEDGRLDLERLKQALRPTTVMVSIMGVNNEIGTVQDVGAIGALCRDAGVVFHTDFAQGLGKVPFDVHSSCAGLVSLSAHKVYGPKGIGALYVRRKGPRVALTPQIFGGGHERGMRSGTLNVPAIVAFGEACRILNEEQHVENKRIKELRDSLWAQIRSGLEGVYVNGTMEHRHPGNLHVSFDGVEAEALIMSLRDIAVSSGAACTSATLEPSHVIRALGLEPERGHNALRFGIGRFNTAVEVQFVAQRVIEQVTRLREMKEIGRKR